MGDKDKSEDLFREFLSRRESGEDVNPEEYLRKHPELSDDLEKLFSEYKEAKGFETSKRDDASRSIGDFKILREIGKGGMGTVYEAEQISLKRKVALKILPSHLSFSDEAVLKFKREAEAGGRQRHIGIVAIYAVGEHGGIHYIAQELINNGVTLSDRLDGIRKQDEQPQGYFRYVADFILKVAEALNHAHESGVIHRDIKPLNILLTDDGQPKVTDFGLAKVEDALALSRTGDFAGSPYYMSPEQAASRRIGIDKRTDIYSLGVTLYEMLTLKRPFEGDTSQEILKKILLVDPIDPHKANSKVPRDLSTICLKAMEKMPEKRFQSMLEYEKDLERFLSGEAILAKPASLGTRLWKRIKKKPVLSTSVSVALLATITLLLYIILWSYPQIRNERNKAIKARNDAETAKIELENMKNLWEGRSKTNEAVANIRLLDKEEAERQRKIAEQQRKIAEERAQEIQRNLEQILRLSDVKRLSELEADAEDLWPAYPENITGYKSWINCAEELKSRLEVHRKTLATLRQDALPYDEATDKKDQENHSEESISERRTWVFIDTETQWQHDTLTDLVLGIERLADEEEGLIKSVNERLAFASTIKKRSVDDYREIWSEVIASIADELDCPQYNGLVIEPILGFVPIGRDPNSSLWEFAHLQTGEIPARDTEGRLLLQEQTCLVFVLIPGGSFMMGAVEPSEDNPIGSPNVDPAADPNESPVHEVTLKPFLMSKYEMTQGQWLRFTKRNHSTYGPGSYYGGKVFNLIHPVERVSWEDCADVLHKLKLRLPSESEWEYAARAGTSTVYWTGDDKKSLQGAANLPDLFCKNNGGPVSWTYEEWLDDGYVVHAPVGTFSANLFGLHDVHGNVSEWCQDIHASYENTPTDGSANKKGLFTPGRPRGRLVR